MSLQDLINYYVNLLIVQYHNKPKAMATIQLLAETLIANNIFLQIENAFDVDTAIGKQLDILGKYAGVDRYYTVEDLENYFSLETYTEVPPSSPPRWGFTRLRALCEYPAKRNFDL